MGKKIPKEMAEQKQKFYKGCKEYGGLKESHIDELWKKIEPFAAYGFNKAHAASYGMVAYKTAYLKANYPAEYLSACMTAESGDIETCSEYIAEARRMGFTILPPDINESFSDFTVVVENNVVTKKIRFGLRNIKNFGEEIGKVIIAERKARGPFKTIEDLLERVQHKNVNKKSLEALIMCGALDAFGERNLLLANLETLQSFHKEKLKQSSHNQTSLFGELPGGSSHTLSLTPTAPATLTQRLIWERELMGLYISGHPLDSFVSQIKKAGTSIKAILAQKGRKKFVLIAHINTIKIIPTKSGLKMAFMTIEDMSGNAEAVIFTEKYKEYKDTIVEGSVVALSVMLLDRDEKKSLQIDQVKKLT